MAGPGPGRLAQGLLGRAHGLACGVVPVEAAAGSATSTFSRTCGNLRMAAASSARVRPGPPRPEEELDGREQPVSGGRVARGRSRGRTARRPARRQARASPPARSGPPPSSRTTRSRPRPSPGGSPRLAMTVVTTMSPLSRPSVPEPTAAAARTWSPSTTSPRGRRTAPGRRRRRAPRPRPPRGPRTAPRHHLREGRAGTVVDVPAVGRVVDGDDLAPRRPQRLGPNPEAAPFAQSTTTRIPGQRAGRAGDELQIPLAGLGVVVRRVRGRRPRRAPPAWTSRSISSSTWSGSL